jgi:hypothetical protein
VDRRRPTEASQRTRSPRRRRLLQRRTRRLVRPHRLLGRRADGLKEIYTRIPGNTKSPYDFPTPRYAKGDIVLVVTENYTAWAEQLNGASTSIFGSFAHLGRVRDLRLDDRRARCYVLISMSHVSISPSSSSSPSSIPDESSA